MTNFYEELTPSSSTLSTQDKGQHSYIFYVFGIIMVVAILFKFRGRFLEKKKSTKSKPIELSEVLPSEIPNSKDELIKLIKLQNLKLASLYNKYLTLSRRPDRFEILEKTFKDGIVNRLISDIKNNMNIFKEKFYNLEREKLSKAELSELKDLWETVKDYIVRFEILNKEFEELKLSLLA
jgi:hypothetical protein